MRIDIGADVVDSGGGTAGRLTGLVFDQESRRVAGFLVRTGEGVPREVFVMPGQANHVEGGRIALALSGEEFGALPDARQHLYVEPGQDLEAEVADAESATASSAIPDPDERPRSSMIPGVALLPNLMTPIEVERTPYAEGEVALEEGLRVVAADGEEVGRIGGFVLNDAAQLVGVAVAGNGELVIDYELLDALDEDANEVTLTVERAALAEGTGGGRAAGADRGGRV